MSARFRPRVLALALCAALVPACGGESASPPSAPASPGGAAAGAATGAAPGGDARASEGTGAARAAAAPQALSGPSQAAALAMSDAELLQRRDLWPARVAFTQETRLDETTWWRAGDELALGDWQGANVILDEGSFLFDVPAERTDVVGRTRAQAASLTPEALALTVDGLRQRPELWPLRLTITTTLGFGNNTMVPPGREVGLRFFEGAELCVYDREAADFYKVQANETNVMSLARERMKLPASELSPHFVRALGAALQPGDEDAARRLLEADYVLVYAGRLGCGRCAEFLPRLKEFYGRAQAAAPAGSRFEVVFLSNDPNADAAQKYVAQSDPPGGVIAFDRRFEAANLLAIPLQMLPGFFVFDRAGNLVDRNHPNAGAPSAQDVLAKFEAKVTGATPR